MGRGVVEDVVADDVVSPPAYVHVHLVLRREGDQLRHLQCTVVMQSDSCVKRSRIDEEEYDGEGEKSWKTTTTRNIRNKRTGRKGIRTTRRTRMKTISIKKKDNEEDSKNEDESSEANRRRKGRKSK